MRTAMMLLLLLASISPTHVHATSCSCAKELMTSIGRELSAGNIGGAEQILHEMERTHPECPEAILAHARVAAAKGAPVEAEDFFVRYAELVPNEARAYSHHARFLLERGQFPRADLLSAQALERDLNDAVALAVHGEILDMKGQTQDAMELLEKACRLDPRNVEAQFRIATIYDRLKRSADAVPHFEKVVETDPRDARAWDYLALNLEPLGEVSRAEQAYRKGLAVNEPGRNFDAFLDYNYGRFLMKTNNLAESKKHLDRAVELTPRIRGPWYERAKLNLRLKDFDQARNDAEQAANLADPAGIIIVLQMWVLLEQVYSRLGQTELANKSAE